MEEPQSPLKEQVSRYLCGKKVVSEEPSKSKKRRKSARAVMQAKLEIAEVVAGKKPNKSGIARSLGYSPKSAAILRPQATHSYQRTIKDFLDRLDAVRHLVVEALESKDYTTISASDLAQILKILNHDMQLLSGGKTENYGIEEDRKIIHTILSDMRSAQNERHGVPALPPATEAV